MMYVRTAFSDLHARARIRRTAVELFGRDGFAVGLRAIADEAGVSLGLIRHHFGSKAELRAACDAAVLDEIARLQREPDQASDPGAFLAALMEMEQHQTLARYLVRTLQAGGDLARAVVDRMAADTAAYVAQGVADGVFVPSRDPEARARHLVSIALGSLLLAFSLAPDDEDPAETWRRHLASSTLPGIELYTDGLLADRTLLDRWSEEAAAAAGSGEDAT